MQRYWKAMIGRANPKKNLVWETASNVNERYGDFATTIRLQCQLGKTASRPESIHAP
jgi:hypothetical protein